jgi:hypothetical protein
MSLFLQILGVIFLLIVAYVAFRVLVLVGKAALVLYGVKQLVSQVEAGAPSATIRLVPVIGARWDNADADALAAGLPALGYEEVGFFDLDIMGGLRRQAWVHSEATRPQPPVAT